LRAAPYFLKEEDVFQFALRFGRAFVHSGPDNLAENRDFGRFSLTGCRTNVEMTINEVDDVCDVKGMHQVIFYGNCAKPLRTFCQLYGIEVVT